MQLKKILLSTVSVLFIADMAMAASSAGFQRPRTQSEEDMQLAMALSLSDQDQKPGAGAAGSGAPRGRSPSPRRGVSASAAGARVRSPSPVAVAAAGVQLDAASRGVLCGAIRTQLGAQMRDSAVNKEVAVSLNGTAYKVKVQLINHDSGDGMGPVSLAAALPLVCSAYSSIDTQLTYGNSATIPISRDMGGRAIETNQNIDAFLNLTFTRQ